MPYAEGEKQEGNTFFSVMQIHQERNHQNTLSSAKYAIIIMITLDRGWTGYLSLGVSNHCHRKYIPVETCSARGHPRWQPARTTEHNV